MKIEITANLDGTLTSDTRERLRAAVANRLRHCGEIAKPIADQIARDIEQIIQNEARARQWSRTLSHAWHLARALRQNH